MADISRFALGLCVCVLGAPTCVCVYLSVFLCVVLFSLFFFAPSLHFVGKPLTCYKKMRQKNSETENRQTHKCKVDS